LSERFWGTPETARITFAGRFGAPKKILRSSEQAIFFDFGTVTERVFAGVVSILAEI
jgi:hypothetical protein